VVFVVFLVMFFSVVFCDVFGGCYFRSVVFGCACF